jgi:hypothetical protein
MKKVLSASTFSIVILLAASAFAGDKTVVFTSPTNINGQKVAPGEYKVRYQVNGSTADVHFLRDKKEVATASGQIASLENAPDRDSVVTQSGSDGNSRLVELQFAKQKSVIKFGSESTAGK